MAIAAGCGRGAGAGADPARRPVPAPPATSTTTGDAAPGPASTPAPDTTPTTAVTAAPAPDLSRPLPAGSLHGIPRPRIVNTGDDHAAILASLILASRWIGENPDPSLLDEVYVPGTLPYEHKLAWQELLVERGYRWADAGYQVLSVEVLSVLPDAASLRLVDRHESERIVDASGQLVEEWPRGTPYAWTVVLVADRGGRWRIADWSAAVEDLVVEL
ncbi:MAG: hypothetical protein M5U14_16965 [Acidimicrobiia bacterium]|nr:hypothetical protein [Acidimicrobiia bacterium]